MKPRANHLLCASAMIGVALMGASAYAKNPSWGWVNAPSDGVYSATCSSSPIVSPPFVKGITCQVKKGTRKANFVSYGFFTGTLGPGLGILKGQFNGNIWAYLGEQCGDGNYYYSDWCSNVDISDRLYCDNNGGGGIGVSLSCTVPGDSPMGYREVWATNVSTPPYLFDFGYYTY